MTTECKWISVEERLPEYGYEVLVAVRYAGTINVHQDYLCPGMEDEDDPEWNTYAWRSVTHWMPLPDPPKEEE